jgi:PAP2 superfamily protein
VRSRFLPNGLSDLIKQIACFWGAYVAYRLVRGVVVDRPEAAFEHARALISVERSLGLFHEAAISAWASGSELLEHLLSWSYLYTHFIVTTAVLAWTYLFRNPSYYFVRNMFLVAMALALLGYLAYPTAPPRFFPEFGFGDPVAEVTGVPPSASGLLVNPYAAIPSMHVAFALLVAGPMVGGLVRKRWARALWAAYPVYVTFVVIATANHWWADAGAGVLVAVVSTVAARALAAARPQQWALSPISS